MKIRGVLFDLDGTLADTVPLCLAAYRAAIEPYAGRALTDAEIVATFGPSEEGTIQVFAPGDAEACLRDYLRHYERLHADYPEPFAGIAPLLARLRAEGARLALVTGKGAVSTDMSLQRFGLSACFECVETGSPRGSRKAEGIRQILHRWKMLPEEAVYVGDTVSDIRIAREVGARIVAAAWAEGAERSLLEAQRPDVVCGSIAGLEAWLLPRLENSPAFAQRDS